jgi:transcriptional regulator with XRE-family HTH domain
MGDPEQPPLESGYAAFVEKLKWLRERDGLSQADLERDMKKRGKKVSQKSFSNIERLEHSSQIKNFAAIAAHFGVPLWVMFVPGLDVSLLEGPKLKRIVTLVQDYLACDDTERELIEKMAAGYAGLHRRK